MKDRKVSAYWIATLATSEQRKAPGLPSLNAWADMTESERRAAELHYYGEIFFRRSEVCVSAECAEAKERNRHVEGTKSAKRSESTNDDSAIRSKLQASERSAR